ncbi:hypothetical protein Hdeb2414_s0001g00037431 [Helianthus debilis subsp. tardiflorus]
MTMTCRRNSVLVDLHMLMVVSEDTGRKVLTFDTYIEIYITSILSMFCIIDFNV